MESTNEESDPPQFPSYPKPTGTPVTDHKTAAPIVKMLNKMMQPKLKAPRGKGLQSDQNVHVKHGKTKKHPNPVRYY